LPTIGWHDDIIEIWSDSKSIEPSDNIINCLEISRLINTIHKPTIRLRLNNVLINPSPSITVISPSSYSSSASYQRTNIGVNLTTSLLMSAKYTTTRNISVVPIYFPIGISITRGDWDTDTTMTTNTDPAARKVALSAVTVDGEDIELLGSPCYVQGHLRFLLVSRGKLAASE
jgi:hypothetical protein